MRFRLFIAAAAGFVLLIVARAPASAAHVLKPGPAADTVRASLACLEKGEASDDDATKLEWYARGKLLAESAIRQDDANADAHFALFANWGRWLQTDGWLKNALRLPALERELDRTLELDPDHTDALTAKGGLYLELPGFLGGDPGKARPLFERVIELDPQAVGARLELADYYVLERQRDRARDLAAEALRLAAEQGKVRFVRRANKLLEQVGPRSGHVEARNS